MIKFQQKPGFTLVESLLYISCSSILSFFFCAYMFSLYQALNKNFVSSRIYLTAYTAHDRLIADIQKTLLNPNSTITIINSKISLSDGTKTKSWSVQDKKLILEIHDLKNTTHRKTVTAEQIDSICFIPDFDSAKNSIGIDCQLVSGNYTISRYTAL